LAGAPALVQIRRHLRPAIIVLIGRDAVRLVDNNLCQSLHHSGLEIAFVGEAYRKGVAPSETDAKAVTRNVFALGSTAVPGAISDKVRPGGGGCADYTESDKHGKNTEFGGEHVTGRGWLT
jgi:hypothetical protein